MSMENPADPGVKPAVSEPPAWRPHQWVAPTIGVLLVLIGLAAFADTMGWHIPDNWAGVPFLIPAAATFYAAWRRYGLRAGQIDAALFGLIAAGVICTASFVIIFFGLNQQLYGPLVLIAIGVALLVRHYWPRRGSPA